MTYTLRAKIYIENAANMLREAEKDLLEAAKAHKLKVNPVSKALVKLQRRRRSLTDFNFELGRTFNLVHVPKPK